MTHVTDGGHGPGTKLPRMHCPRLLRPGALVAGLLAALVLMPAQAQWVWKDKDGRVNASDLPPPRGVSDKDILQRPETVVRRPAAAAPVAASAAAARASAPVDPQLEARRRAAEQEQQAKARADDEKAGAQRAENCRRARSHLQALESGQRIARMNDRGEREVLDDKARADEMRQANETIASECR